MRRLHLNRTTCSHVATLHNKCVNTARDRETSKETSSIKHEARMENKHAKVKLSLNKVNVCKRGGSCNNRKKCKAKSARNKSSSATYG